MKHVFRVLVLLAGLIISTIVAGLLAAFVLSVLSTHPAPSVCPEKKPVYVTTNGVHLSIIVPLNQLDTAFAEELELTPGTRFVSFGWGDRGFYLTTPTWADLTFKTAFRALFLRTPSAMHIDDYSFRGNSWHEVQLCPEQQGKLLADIRTSFTTDSLGHIIVIPHAGYTPSDRFFEANGHFTCFRTCNVWVNDALKTAGIPTSIWSPFDKGVLFHLKKWEKRK
jgi:uncharacterized protein (TIGR02117 family)